MSKLKGTTKLIEKARQSLQRGEREICGWHIITLKIDLDLKLDEEEKTMWDDSRKSFICNCLDGVVIDIVTTDTERGLHTVLNWMSLAKWSDEKLNFIQMLAGDDIIRYKINKARLKRGVKWEESNILFSKVLQRFAGEKESRLKVAIENIVGEIK